MSLANEFERFAVEVSKEFNDINKRLGGSLNTKSKTVAGAINELADSIKQKAESESEEASKFDFVKTFYDELRSPDGDDECPCHFDPHGHPPHHNGNGMHPIILDN